MTSEYGAFIFACLDDYGLDPYEFRLYARIQRRAGISGKCYESIENMAKACLMSAKVARRSLAHLLKSKLVNREDVPGCTSVFTLNPQSEWEDGHTPGKYATPSKNDRGLDINRITSRSPNLIQTPGKNDRGSKNDRGMAIDLEGGKCPNLIQTPGKNDTPPLAKTTGEGIPSKDWKLINQDPPLYFPQEPATVAPEEETHGIRRGEEKGQEGEPAQEGKQTSTALAKASEESVNSAAIVLEGKSPAAGAISPAREKKYDERLGMRPRRPRVKFHYPEGEWLTENGCMNAEFMEWVAKQWKKGKAFCDYDLDYVIGKVASFYQRAENHGTLEIDWNSYAAICTRRANNIKTRMDAGISIPEAEQQEIVKALPAITSQHEPYAEYADSAVKLPQEALQIAPAIQTTSTFPQCALEGKIEASAPAANIDPSVMPWEAALEAEKDNPPTPEEMAAKQRIAQMLKGIGGKKSGAPAEPEKTNFDRLKTLVDFARRDPMTIMQVREAEWREEIEVDWNEEVETPYPISIRPALGF